MKQQMRPKEEKRAYTPPVMLASEVRKAADSVCGWYTQCGKDVKCRS